MEGEPTCPEHGVFLRLRIVLASLILMVVGACAADPPASQEPSKWEPPEYEALDPALSLSRVSIALRGIQPSQSDLELIQQEPERLIELARSYADSPEFGETIKDMYAEILLMRSVDLVLPSVGDLEGVSSTDVAWTLSEEPLNLIREVVVNDEPFSAIVTADWTMLDELGARFWDSHTYDSEKGGLQKVNFTDERPAAGILSTGAFLIRHSSNGGNYHRGRADRVSDFLLCSPFGGRDIPIAGDIDLSDDEAVAQAVGNQTECVACHQTVDPLAAHFWGFRARLTAFQITSALEDGCPEGISSFACYPVPMYTPLISDRWSDLELRPPSYWGQATESLEDVGKAIAEDPRFARCAAQNFAAYLTQSDKKDLDPVAIARFQEKFTASGFSAKELAVEIVTAPDFLSRAQVDAPETELPGIQILRPEQLERLIFDLTGFRLEYEVPVQRVGEVRVLANDNVGFRAMAGGIDGASVTSPTHTPTPIKLLVHATYAEEAAGFIVDSDFAADKDARRLLTEVDSGDNDAPLIRAQLKSLHARIYGHPVDSDDPRVDALLELWQAAGGAQDARLAWKATLSAMFQSPDLFFY